MLLWYVGVDAVVLVWQSQDSASIALMLLHHFVTHALILCGAGCQQKECQCQCTVHNYTLCPWGGHYDDTEATRKFLSEEHCLNHTAILPFATNKVPLLRITFDSRTGTRLDSVN